MSQLRKGKIQFKRFVGVSSTCKFATVTLMDNHIITSDCDRALKREDYESSFVAVTLHWSAFIFNRTMLDGAKFSQQSVKFAILNRLEGLLRNPRLCTNAKPLTCEPTSCKQCSYDELFPNHHCSLNYSYQPECQPSCIRAIRLWSCSSCLELENRGRN